MSLPGVANPRYLDTLYSLHGRDRKKMAMISLLYLLTWNKTKFNEYSQMQYVKPVTIYLNPPYNSISYHLHCTYKNSQPWRLARTQACGYNWTCDNIEVKFVEKHQKFNKAKISVDIAKVIARNLPKCDQLFLYPFCGEHILKEHIWRKSINAISLWNTFMQPTAPVTP